MEKETVKQEGDFKIKRKPGRPKKLQQKEEITKLDLNKKEENAVQEPETTKVVLQSDEQSETPRKEVEVELQEVGQPHSESEETTEKTKEEVTVINESVEETAEPQQEEIINEPQSNLPENVEKLVQFMEETGGTVEDYVTLNRDYTQFDERLLIKEYYKKTKPHLNDEEVSFLMEDRFSYDEEVDEERFVRKQKLAYKEEVAKARTFLESMKKKYYDEIKLRPSLSNEQKKAMDFFNRYNKEQSTIQQKRSEFVQNTENYFNQEFEGFDFNVGEKRFKYKVSNPFEMAKTQSDVSKIINKYMDTNGNITDMSGYHKAIYAARNADRIAQHFYEQGKADATRDIVAKSKNIDNTPRSGETGETMPNGWRVRAINGVDATKLKIKRRT